MGNEMSPIQSEKINGKGHQACLFVIVCSLLLIERSDFWHESREQASEPLFDLAAGFEDLLVAQLSCAKAGGQVGDATEAHDLDAHVAGNDRLRYC